MIRYTQAAIIAILLLIAVDQVRTRLRKRRQLEPLAKAVEAMRRAATQRITYRAPTPAEAALGGLQELFEAAERELHEQGFTVLGDQAEEQADGGTTGITRWFVDPSGTITGWFAVVRSRKTSATRPTMMLFSESESGQFFVTGRGAIGRSLARPPAIHRAFYSWDEGLARALKGHLGQTVHASGATSSPLRSVDGLPEATALLQRLRETTARWRTAEPPDRLLEEDVRSLLQERFAELGSPLIKFMTSQGS